MLNGQSLSSPARGAGIPRARPGTWPLINNRPWWRDLATQTRSPRSSTSLVRTACVWPCRLKGTARPAGLGEDTLLLKTGRMTGAEVDVENRRVRVSAAAKWRDVSALASPEGLAPLSGSSAEVGVVGYTLGGGHGWLARKHGLACNSVLAAELVAADGKLVRADPETSPSCSGRCAAAAGTSALLPRWSWSCTPCQRFTPACWPGRGSARQTSSTRGACGLRAYLTRWPHGRGFFRSRRCPISPSPSAVASSSSSRSLTSAGRTPAASAPAAARARTRTRHCAPAPPAALGHLHMDPEDPVPFAGSGQLLDELRRPPSTPSSRPPARARAPRSCRSSCACSAARSDRPPRMRGRLQGWTTPS